MSRIAAILAPALLLGAASAQEDVHAPWDAFLSEYVAERPDGLNVLAYDEVTGADHDALKAYIDDLEALKPSEMRDDERLAYYFNLYNAAIVDLALDNRPLSSIKSVGGGLFNRGPWKLKVVTVEGEELSFDDIEHGRVRAAYDEPRVHYAFNCASVGCPDLKASAWRPETLDAELDAAARAYVAHPRGIDVDDEGEIDASSIYKWFQEDFGGSEEGVLRHVLPYAEGEKRAAIARALAEGEGIDDYDYDWSLNAPR